MTISPASAAFRGTNAAAPEGNNRLFAAGAYANYRSHLLTYGPAGTGYATAGLLELLEASGLTGRGGAGFAAWRKAAATAAARGRFGGGPVVIANGAEGEPLSFKDRTLLHHAPHLVLDGLLAAADALAASRVYLYTAASNLPPVRQAIGERPEAGRIRLVEAPDTFISGEASAVVNAIESGSATPVDRIGRLTEHGFKGRPTLVQNVETLAHLGLIARFGPDWFRSAGTERDPGTRLVSVSGDVPAEQVLEVAGETPLVDVLRAAGADPSALSGVLVGGFHGRWVDPGNLLLSAAGPAQEIVRPGAGVVFALGSHRCGLAETARIAAYLATQSAGKCGPCRFGLPALSATLDRLAYGGADPALLPELRRLQSMVAGRGSCHHPDGTVQLTASALAVFADDVDRHLAGYCNRKELLS
ncbi:hypothetical protein LVY72_22015 [Arthrobacter sp. I2-34]|uniref:NADH-ubiquinone oxidoreductase 51kDa subunit iron-sulphur binding domain-containing protein n=1 Tax=Arthrobacter hankyongi TaxID=2904801 RepID=A0ABS9LD41_9MICC|nr:NADH-ubiquinone oxidoreductase-F iron-sulfur binding region domain-containing protein [Arthrobacter hankyongi]MCG2624570.1 hypothetical protein [Arthrobacter hankyongi]